MDKKKIVFASNNAGKIREINLLLSSFNVEVIAQKELGVEEIEEPAPTFVENAILKARHAARVTGLPALADDSGLAVAALNGAPGIYSARYAGAHGDAKANIEKLLLALTNSPDNRHAAFYCVLAYLSHADDPTPLICTGKWDGEILQAPTGSDGFGYDPVFFVPSENKSAAQLTVAEKNKLSHRGKALQSFISLLPDKL